MGMKPTKKSTVTGLTNLKRHFVNSDMMWSGLEHHLANLASVSEWGSAPNHGIPPIFWGLPNSPPNTHWPVIIFHSNTAPWWGLSCSWVPNLYSKSNKSKFEQKFPIAMLIYVGLAKGTPKTESLRFPSHPNSRETPHPNQHGASPRGPKEICKDPSEQGVGSKKSKVSFFHQVSSIFPEKSLEQPHRLRQRSPNSQACVPFFRPKRMPLHGIRPGSSHSREAHDVHGKSF